MILQVDRASNKFSTQESFLRWSQRILDWRSLRWLISGVEIKTLLQLTKGTFHSDRHRLMISCILTLKLQQPLKLVSTIKTVVLWQKMRVIKMQNSSLRKISMQSHFCLIWRAFNKSISWLRTLEMTISRDVSRFLAPKWSSSSS